jgi:hypothetical protein
MLHIRSLLSSWPEQKIVANFFRKKLAEEYLQENKPLTERASSSLLNR